MEWLIEKLTDLFRPWHDNGLPEDLGFGAIDASLYVRESMKRFAWLSAQETMAFGVFEIIGMQYAPRAARAWWPTGPIGLARGPSRIRLRAESADGGRAGLDLGPQLEGQEARIGPLNRC